ncbi:MAG: response regulator [Flavobacteriales bacterium]|nr:response regulator [Flavobacteriales bacterium]
MKIKVLIVEDEILVAEDIAGDLTKDDFEVTDIALSSHEAMLSIDKTLPHIILMDINIKGDKDGIETAQLINQKYAIPIIYLTSNTSSKYVERAIKTGPHAFISKPFRYSDLAIAIEIAAKKHNEALLSNSQQKLNLNSIFVKSGDYHRKVLLSEIMYVEADGSYCKVHTKGQSYIFSFNLNQFQNQVLTPLLKRVHRSYMVNLQNVDGLNKSTLLIADKIIPVSNTYREEVFEYFNKM